MKQTVQDICRELFPLSQEYVFSSQPEAGKTRKEQVFTITIKKFTGKVRVSNPDRNIPKREQQLISETGPEFLGEPADFAKLMECPELCNHRTTLTNIMIPSLAGIKESVTIPILIVRVS